MPLGCEWKDSTVQAWLDRVNRDFANWTGQYVAVPENSPQDVEKHAADSIVARNCVNWELVEGGGKNIDRRQDNLGKRVDWPKDPQKEGIVKYFARRQREAQRKIEMLKEEIELLEEGCLDLERKKQAVQSARGSDDRP